MLLIDVATSPLLLAGAHYLNMLRQSLKSLQSELCVHLVLKQKDLNHFWFLCFDRVLVRYQISSNCHQQANDLSDLSVALEYAILSCNLMKFSISTWSILKTRL